MSTAVSWLVPQGRPREREACRAVVVRLRVLPVMHAVMHGPSAGCWWWLGAQTHPLIRVLAELSAAEREGLAAGPRGLAAKG